MSETAACREVLAPFCSEPYGLDVGAGGDRIVPHAWTFDLPNPYTSVGNERLMLRGDCRSLQFIADGALDWIYSSHLLEDFYYYELPAILAEWRRCLRDGGLLVTNCPDQERFLSHCARTGQGINLAHKEASFGLEPFRKVLTFTGPWEEVFCVPEFGPYSWLTVHKKL